jgi:hypothetical protein
MKRLFHHLPQIVATVLLVVYALGVGAYGALMLGTVEPASQATWGVTFSHSQAQDLGLDWQETYRALLDDAGVRSVRIPIYWDELESQPGEYDFSTWDWQLDELKKRGGQAIIAVGYKLPRWPECRFPGWLETTNPKNLTFSQRLFQMERAIVVHYRDHPAVAAWQVENEPLLEFGICPETDSNLLDDEVKLVRMLDPSRPVILTDTGEFSLWIEAGKRADIVGSTLYRIIHDPTLGYVHYNFISPTQYARKVSLLKLWQPNDKVIVTELQAEPWVRELPISANSIEEQYRTLSPQQFRDNIKFARATGIDTFYLWGSEWWYWLKLQGHEEIWNEATVLFEESH